MVEVDNDTLRLVVMKNMETLGKKVDKELMRIRGTNKSFIVPASEVRFSNGEGKVVLNETIRGKDLYILSDIGNHGCTYKMYGHKIYMGPDEHFQDIKRVISAVRSHSVSNTVVMPLLYESRQHKRKGRESSDCAVALRELEFEKVNGIITFDAHDPSIQNAIPFTPFENFYPTNVILTDFLINEKIESSDLIVISPDMGAGERARYYADMLKCGMGVFNKRRDFTRVVDGKNPILAHEYLGPELTGKNAIIVDDMIASGESMMEVVEELHKRGINKVFLIATYSLFTEGIKKFNEYHKKGLFNKLYTTNLSYIQSDALKQEWIKVVDCSKFLAQIIDTLNKKEPISPLLNGKEKIVNTVKKDEEK